MGEDFYCTLKLISGEEIFALISVDENNGDPLILLQNPVVLKFSGPYIKIKPWIEVSDDDLHIIKIEKVITMTEITNTLLIETYNEYLESNEKPLNNSIENSGEVELSNKMGYISSVKEARENLENIFKNI